MSEKTWSLETYKVDYAIKGYLREHSLSIINEISCIISATLDMKLFDTFRYKDGTVRILTIIEYDEETMRKKVYEMIRKNGLTFGKKGLFTRQHLLSLWCLLSENEWRVMNDNILEQVCKYFNRLLDEDKMWEQCQSIGASWEGCQ